MKTDVLLDKALDLIVELVEDDPSDFCCELHEIPEENNYCAEHCDNFNKSCVLRYLKVIKKQSRPMNQKAGRD